MASLLLRLPIAAVIVLLALSSATVTARPCRTFIISSYSFRNPSSNTFATITEIRSLTPLYINDKPYEFFLDRPIQHQNLELETETQGASHPRAPLGFSTAAYDFSSLRDRTKDILSVALALLFGVGCGALTAATMYLVWSVFTARHDFRAASYGEFSDDDEIESPKKMGYIKIPPAEAAAAAPAPPAKDSSFLGYKVRSSDTADVAQKLEQLEMVMGSAQEDGISHLATDTVHYDPTDLYSWVQTMLSELNPSPTQSTLLDPVSPDAVSPDSVSPAAVGTVPEPTRPVALVDSQETGVRLVHTLMACAEAVQQENLKLADALVKHIGLLSQAGAMRKVASYFAQALARRIYRIYPEETMDSSFSDVLHMHFYESCPYLKFAHFTANQAILEAFATAGRVHVIDFGLKQGMQWPALMQALALRPGGPPTFRLTGIGPPQQDNTDALQQVGWKLAQLAQTIGVQFEFRGFVCNSLADLDPNMLEIRPGEAVAVNSVFELHRMLARPGSVDRVLNTVKQIKPEIVTIVEQEANHNGPVFVDRFREALHYYSSLFDSLEGSSSSSPSTGSGSPSQDLLMSELYLGRQICNVVACEGLDRVERHEMLSQWRARMGSAGFDPVHLGSNAFKQASTLLALFAGGDGYRVEENNGCLMLGWHTRPLIATSAWKLPPGES